MKKSKKEEEGEKERNGFVLTVEKEPSDIDNLV